MNILDIIEKKEKKLELTKSELEFVINGYLNESIPDYQMSALLMAILLNGMTEKETVSLTEIMLNSGDKITFDFNVVDKHSTGGVGDKTTLVLISLVASLGTKVAKMSGRGLGHTGGTIDKLESIAGFNTEITIEELKQEVEEIGASIAGQTGNLCPADKKIYALRDVTGTVASIPLIASSIMSKKLASGASNIVIDLKVGEGALMNNIDDARELANIMIKIGKAFGKNVICVLTNMNQPLGYAIGNALEVREAIDTLNGKGPKDLEELVINLASLMISLDQNVPMEILIESVENALKNGLGFEKFKEIVSYQGGDINNIPVATNIIEIKAEKSGYVKNISALKIGELARRLGAGRLSKTDEIDYTVGIVLTKKVGDEVNAGETIAKVYTNKVLIPEKDVSECFEITDFKVDKPKLIYEIIK